MKIRSINYASDTETVTLTWDSRESESYSVRYSTDLVNWDNDLDDSIPADAGETTTRSFNVAGLATANGSLFFRVERN